MHLPEQPPRRGDPVLKAVVVAMALGLVGAVLLVATRPQPPGETVARRGTEPVSPREQAGLPLPQKVEMAQEADGQKATAALRVPAGFRAVPGSAAEPYTQTSWATEIVHEVTGIVLVYVPAGTFTMGSPEDEVGHGKNETQHRVTLTQGFYLGKYEVTQAQWLAAMASSPSHFRNAGPEAPVEQVSWNTCQEFCRKLANGIRLPTEAEWEYACRAGTTGPRAGDMAAMGWYRSNSGNTTHPVGQKQPNAWGLYDMNGNVWEWCQDWYGDYPAGPVTDPAGPTQGTRRVFRGGSWEDIDASFFRWAYRCNWSPDDRTGSLGFRVARTADGSLGAAPRTAP